MMWKENTAHRQQRKRKKKNSLKTEVEHYKKHDKKKLEVWVPVGFVFFIYFAFDYASSRILFLSPFLMLLVKIFMWD